MRSDFARRVSYYGVLARAFEARSLGLNDRADDVDAAAGHVRDHLPNRYDGRVDRVAREVGL
jgi:hypothetical protein